MRRDGQHYAISAHSPRVGVRNPVDHFVTDRPDPAEVAARLRGFIAQHDRDRQLRQALILALDAYSYRLKLQNMVAGEHGGRSGRGPAAA
jgi:hypothetical protein